MRGSQKKVCVDVVDGANFTRLCVIKNSTKISDGRDCFEGTFRRAIWPFLLISQLHGVMPLNGISCRSLSELQFKWKSFRTVYAAIVTFTLSTYSSLLICKIFTNPEFSHMRMSSIQSNKPRRRIPSTFLPFFFSVNLIYYAMNTIGLISSFALSMYWPELMQNWQTVESLPIFRNCTYKATHLRQIRFITSTALFLSLGKFSLLCPVSGALFWKILVLIRRHIYFA